MTHLLTILFAVLVVLRILQLIDGFVVVRSDRYRALRAPVQQWWEQHLAYLEREDALFWGAWEQGRREARESRYQLPGPNGTARQARH